MMTAQENKTIGDEKKKHQWYISKGQSVDNKYGNFREGNVLKVS